VAEEERFTVKAIKSHQRLHDTKSLQVALIAPPYGMQMKPGFSAVSPSQKRLQLPPKQEREKGETRKALIKFNDKLLFKHFKRH
jgi:hypothetical protein